jgi:hypothetical protein
VRRYLATIGGALLLVAVLAAPAQAAVVTVGSPLTGTYSFQTGTTATGSWANIQLPEAGAQPASPVSGTVVRWRVKGAFAGGPFSLQVLRPAGGSSYSSVATSTPQTPTGEATQEFATDLPIQAGDVVAIETSHASDRIGAAAMATGVNAFDWIPPLVDGGASAAPHTFEIETELGFNADVEYESPAVLPGPQIVVPLNTPEANCVVPKLSGKKLKAVKKKLVAADCKLGKVKKLNGATAKTGKVKKQSPKPGKVLALGSKVSVKLG